MVKEKRAEEVCLDPSKPISGTFAHGDPFEQVTVPDVSMSLSQMVATNTVMGGSSKYVDPNFDDDDDAHEHPDYSKMGDLDPVEKAEYVSEFDNYTKQVEDDEKEIARTKAEAEEEARKLAAQPKVEKASSGAGA